MDALLYLNFVQMAEEGIRKMREAMSEAGLPSPDFSPPDVDRVTCTLYNNIDKRTQARTDLSTLAEITPTNVTPNIYPLRTRSPIDIDPDAPFADEAGRPTFKEVRSALHDALKAAGFRIDSFSGVTAVDFTDEYIVTPLKKSKIASIYPGISFRLIELKRSFYLVLDHIVEVRNRTNAMRIMSALPWLRLDNHRRCFVRHEDHWSAGRIIESKNGFCRMVFVG